MGAINRIPEGLLGLLSSKTDGVNPKFLSESVAPVLNMEPFYFADQASHDTVAFAQGAVGNGANIVVPAAQVWLLFAMDLEWIGAGIGQTIDTVVSLQSIPGAVSSLSAVVIFAPGPKTAAAIGDIVTSSKVYDRPLPLAPGSTIRANVNATSLASNGTLNILFYRLIA